MITSATLTVFVPAAIVTGWTWVTADTHADQETAVARLSRLPRILRDYARHVAETVKPDHSAFMVAALDPFSGTPLGRDLWHQDSSGIFRPVCEPWLTVADGNVP